MKKPVYWVVSIETKNDDVLAMALVTVAKTLAVRLEFTLPKEGKYKLQLWVDCDSYMDFTGYIDLETIYVASPEEGEYPLELHVDCDSYMGLAQYIDLETIYVDN
jgi:hypothetical protein